MREFSIVITDNKLKNCNGNVREAFMYELYFIAYTFNREDGDELMRFDVCDYSDRREKKEAKDVEEDVEEEEEHEEDENEHENEEEDIYEHHSDNDEEENTRHPSRHSIEDELQYYTDEFNKWNDFDIVIESHYFPDDDSDTEFNSIDFTQMLNTSISKEMAKIRKDLTLHGLPPGDDSHELTFHLTKEAKDLIKSRFGTLDNIYYITITTRDIDDGEEYCYDNGVYDMPHFVSKYSGGVVNWFDVFINKCDGDGDVEIRRASVYDNINDKNKYRDQDLDFYIEEGASKDYMLVYEFIYNEMNSPIYLLHRRRNEVQTLEYINDGATREINEIMFYHGENGGLRVVKRSDSANCDDGQETAHDMYCDVGKAVFADIDLEFTLRWKSNIKNSTE